MSHDSSKGNIKTMGKVILIQMACNEWICFMLDCSVNAISTQKESKQGDWHTVLATKLSSLDKSSHMEIHGSAELWDISAAGVVWKYPMVLCPVVSWDTLYGIFSNPSVRTFF